MPLKIRLPKLPIDKVGTVIMRARSEKARGLHEITFRVWKGFWPVLGAVIVKLHQASLNLNRRPQRWRTAEMLVLGKPNKPDYSKPKGYRPISFLETVSKGLEAVVARRTKFSV